MNDEPDGEMEWDMHRDECTGCIDCGRIPAEDVEAAFPLSRETDPQDQPAA